MQVKDIIGRVGRLLADPTHVRWTEEELIDYINDAQRQIVLLVPDSNSQTQPFSLKKGSKQELPQGGIRLLRITRNMGTDGVTPGRVIYPTLRSALDAENPDWHTEEGDNVEHYIYDAMSNSKTFYVYPSQAVDDQHQVEIVFSTNPTRLAPDDAGVLDAELDIGEQYINPIIDWVLYRCWAKDAEYAGNTNRAQMHEGSFYNQVSTEGGVSQAYDPNRRVRNAEIDGTAR